MFDERAGARAGGSEPGFWRLAGTAAMVAGAAAFMYAVAFAVLRNAAIASLMLTAGGLLSGVAAAGLYRRVVDAAPGIALVGLGFAVIGATGAAVHGAYEVANVIHPPATTTDLPNAVDPRGFLTFGVSGLGAFTLSAIALQSGSLPRAWGYLGLVLGVLLVLVYLGRLIVLDAASPLILGPAGIAGFVASPVWYVWLGRELYRGPAGTGAR